MNWSTIEVLTAALVIITGVYAALTFGIMRATSRSVTAMREQTDALTRPYVTIAPMIIPLNPIIFLRIANTGKTGASNLRLQLDRPFHRYGKPQPSENLQAFSAFSQEIASFPPGSELVFGLAQGFVIFGENADESKTPSSFRVTAEYSFFGRTTTETTEVDLRAWRGMDLAYDALVNELKGIRKVLEKTGPDS